jgi:sulfur relay (sulfurtransferase) complex TusBCD TusD component (DsrE family)
VNESRTVIGFCIGTGPASEKTAIALRLIDASLDAGMAPRVFLYDDGIYNGLNGVSVRNLLGKFVDLAQRGVPVYACSNMAKHRGVGKENCHAGLEIVSLLAFSELVLESRWMLQFQSHA